MTLWRNTIAPRHRGKIAAAAGKNRRGRHGRHARRTVAAALTAMAVAFAGTSGVVPNTTPHATADVNDAQPTITERGDITQQGRWFADGDGRALLTAGVNMVYKLDPYTPEASGFDEHDADWLVENGFDSVRLGFIWKAVEPEPGVYDDEYIESVRQTTRMLTDRGIMVLLDAHQDQYNEAFQGEFAPDWAVITDEVPSTLPLGFPANQVGNVGLLRALDNFLANRKGPGGVGLQDRFAAMWGHVASKFKDEPGLMGYGIMNEPWAGSSWPICVVALGDCGVAKQGLDQMHEKVAQEIVANDPRAIVHYEPFSTWNQGWNTRPARPNVEQAALSFHVYCTTTALLNSYAGCETTDGLAFANANLHAEQFNSATLLTEFGATNNWGILNGITSVARKNLTGWQYWAYCGCDDPTTHNQYQQGIVADPKVPGPVSDSATEPHKVAILAAPHARAIAGTPTETTWDHHTRTYTASWTNQRVDGAGTFGAGAITEVAVPKINFPGGYNVEVTGGEVVSEPGADRLFIASDGSAEVKLTITPIGDRLPGTEPVAGSLDGSAPAYGGSTIPGLEGLAAFLYGIFMDVWGVLAQIIALGSSGPGILFSLTPGSSELNGSGAGLLPEGQPGVGSQELGSYGAGSTEGSVELSNEADSST